MERDYVDEFRLNERQSNSFYRNGIHLNISYKILSKKSIVCYSQFKNQPMLYYTLRILEVRKLIFNITNRKFVGTT